MSEAIIVYAAVIENDGRFLIGRRKKGKSLEGMWEFPGGKKEENEAPEQTLKREFKEEFGVKIEVLGYVGENVHDYGNFTIRLIAYHAKHISGDFRLSDHDKIKWILPNEFENYPLASADIPISKLVTNRN